MAMRNRTMLAALLGAALLAAALLAAGMARAAEGSGAAADPNAREASPADPNAAARPAPAGLKIPRGGVFTNKDLEKYRSASRPNTIVVGTLKIPPAGEEPLPEEAVYPEEKERRLAENRAAIAAAEARIPEIDRRVASLRNPFLPRPALSEAQREAEAGRSAKDLVASLQAERADLEARLAALRQEQEQILALPVRPRPAAAVTNPDAPPETRPQR